jgi:hypothetical protein
MALDIHRLDNHDHLFGIDDIKFKNLEDIFTAYKHWTGISINQYDDRRSKQRPDILEFRGLLTYFINNNYDIEFFGD